jgi:hypothetical protein
MQRTSSADASRFKPARRFRSLQSSIEITEGKQRDMKTLVILLSATLIAGAGAEPRGGAYKRGNQPCRSDHNWIIERQEGYQVQGVPTERIISSGREIDVYSNGLMFEGNSIVGVKQP